MAAILLRLLAFLLLITIGIRVEWALFIIALEMLLALALEMVARDQQKSHNPVEMPSPYAIPAEAAEIHSRQLMIDLHADPLLWQRDLLVHNTFGHIDLPRLEEGNVGLQVFGLVTKSPRGLNMVSNRAESTDDITLLSIIQAQPPRTWFSLTERAVYQCRKLHKFAEKSGGRLVVVKTTSDLETLAQKRAAGMKVTGGLLSMEGAHALEGKITNLDRLYDEGLRMVGLVHFFDNEAGGSAHGISKAGLTDFGRDVVRCAVERGMVLDLAHASPQIIDDVLEMTDVPVVVSHTGVKGTFDSPRNVSDAHIKAIAARGGVIGLTMFAEAVGETTLAATVRAIRYVVELAGIEAAAIGGDLDGSVRTPVDVSGMPLLTAELLSAGFSEDEIGRILGLNAYRVLHSLLPR